jgi:hypothetical protein
VRTANLYEWDLQCEEGTACSLTPTIQALLDCVADAHVANNERCVLRRWISLMLIVEPSN